MPIIFQCDGKRMDIEDLPLEEYVKIAEVTGMQWWQITTSHPATNAAVAGMMVVACAKHLGIETPVLTPKTVVTLFEVEQAESVPTVYNDGIPDPKAQAPEVETT